MPAFVKVAPFPQGIFGVANNPTRKIMMYSLELNGGEQISVDHRNHVSTFAMDGTLPNPLEAFYAALAGCAGVYAHKACKKLDLDSQGITISCRPFAPPGNPLALKRFKTTVNAGYGDRDAPQR